MTQKPLNPLVGKIVMITTEHRGVFAGDLIEYDAEKRVAVLREARMCVYWSTDVRGVLGLAANGPTKSCKVGPAAPRIELSAVTALTEVSPKAWKAWEAEPWAK